MRLNAWLCVCLNLVCASGDAEATGNLAFALDYQVSGDTACPDAAAVAATANREVGRSVLNAAAKRRASLVISKSGDGLTARVAFTDALGAEEAVRSVSATTDRCRDLVRVFGLLVALHVQAVESRETSPTVAVVPPKPKAKPPADPPKAKPSETPPKPPPPPEPKPVEVTVVQAPAVKPELPPDVRALALWVGTIARSGLAPGLNPGVRFGVGWYWQPSLRLNAELDGVWAGRTQVASGGAYDVGAGTLALSACWSPGAAKVQGWICPAVSAGVVRVVGKELDVSRSDVASFVMAGVDGRLSIPMFGSWLAEFVVSAALNPRPHSVDVNNANAWTSQPFWFAGSVVAGYRWGGRGH